MCKLRDKYQLGFCFTCIYNLDHVIYTIILVTLFFLRHYIVQNCFKTKLVCINIIILKISDILILMDPKISLQKIIFQNFL